MALPKLKVPKPPKVPKAPAWQTYKPARPNYAPPKQFTTPVSKGGAAPQGYAKYGTGTPAPWGQTAAKKPTVATPMVPTYTPVQTQIPNYGYGQGAGLIGGDWEVQEDRKSVV